MMGETACKYKISCLFLHTNLSTFKQKIQLLKYIGPIEVLYTYVTLSYMLAQIFYQVGSSSDPVYTDW